MVLVFGGTTEGRKAIEVLEQAGKPFYYSTRGSEQEVQLVHGERLTGAMDKETALTFCREHDIRVIIDAAHPFAEQLHTTVAEVATELDMPVVRYERIYPPHTDDIAWCRDYDEAISKMEEAGIERLLMLTGVQTIGRLKPYWEKHDCWCRILDRDTSRRLAAKLGFPEERLIGMREERGEIRDERGEIRDERGEIRDERGERRDEGLIAALHPDAIITKESGTSGGFVEKVAAAKENGVKVFVVERPRLYASFPALRKSIVDGPHGLRRAVETLLPGFFPLKSGLTTGTCATAAVKAAMLSLQGEEEEAVWVSLPNGESVLVDIESVGLGEATMIKDFSDDPDVTRGCRIRAKVKMRDERLERRDEGSSIRFLQGEGVGRVTLPGLGIPVGEPAINPVPRQMMTEAVRALTDDAVDITISVEHGRELAKRTFNERVGVVDGISIIGSSGIVQPLSNEAFVQSIHREMEVARAMGCTAIGLASGKNGEEALTIREPQLRVIHYGNFIGASLEQAHALGFQRIVLGIMLGKAVKLAEGHMDTHSHKVLMNKTFLADIAREAGIEHGAEILDSITMARELWHVLPKEGVAPFIDTLIRHCMQHCEPLVRDAQLEILIIDDEGQIWRNNKKVL